MITENAYAKINLALDVVRKRADQFHDLKMITIPLELHDVLTFEESDQIELDANQQIEDNSILKAAKLMKDTYQVAQGAKINLTKNIPVGAGLGGGSADIAATLRGLNRLWKLDKSLEELEQIALKLGSDTVFCLHNKSAYVYGRGENLLFITDPPVQDIYLYYPDIEVSTKKVFENLIINHEPQRFNRLFTLYVNEKFKNFFEKYYNVLTETSMTLYPELRTIQKQIRKLSRYARMSGSGSTFFIPIFSENERKIIKKTEKLGLNMIKTKVKH
ncbi:MAG: 4-(cytidine 5'-diphospho)-2-C-methyl-D-erythritol kinase [Acholeplasmataceae bacterium]|jgi:4-diphosphocytidyl-2-C-methyl-D-erythritol kinase|nr:4-(cytidine 5'-diphospho)-2-C-methyl-D-erythritol kinase [Acholeplasmataceae bacterium]